jgi:ABC-type nitrate/sulfonate/bicarbonate transport system substrate-binding protein
VTHELDRRTFLRGSALLGAGAVAMSAGGASTLVDAFTRSAGASTLGSKQSLGSIAYQLSWLKNIQFAGSYFADSNGYYKDEGFKNVTLVAGGPNVTVEPQIVAGKQLIGNSSPDFVAAARKEGAPLVIIGAQYQKNPFAIMSMAKTPIRTPQEMIGKRIGVATTNTVIWEAFLKVNKISTSKVTAVPVQFDPIPLTQGDVDGWMSFYIDEPNILRSQGFDVTTFLFDDFNYPLFGQVYVVREDSLKDHRDQLVAFMRAEIRGWQDALKDPAEGARLAVNVYGKSLGLDLAEQTLEIKDQNALLVSLYTKQKGLLSMSPAKIAQSIKTIAAGGTTGVKAKELFTDEILVDAYGGKTSL